MNKIEFKYHFKRLVRMLRYKGIRYTLSYFFCLAFYNSNLISEKILYPLFPRSVFYPRYIEVEVSTLCNLRCEMCEHTYWKEKNQMMNLEQLKGIVEQFPKLQWIGLTGIGESFLNPDFMKMVDYVKSKGIYLELYDSFFLINEKFAGSLVNSGIDRMIVSIEGATAETYEKIRKGAKFNRSIENIKNIIKLKKEKKAHYPEVTFHYIVTKENAKEAIDFVDLVHKIMGQEDTSIYFSSILHPFPEIEKMVIAVPDNLVAEINLKCKQLGIKVAWNRNVPTEKEPISKCNEWTMPFIFVDGTVVPCCAGNESNKRDYQRKTELGNIFKTPFKEIWEGPKYQKLREMVHEGKTPPACRYCTIYKV